MPTSLSAKKTLRQNETRRARNHSAKSAMRTQIRKLREAITAGNVEDCKTLFLGAVKQIDKAAAKNIIHANTAARTKSRLSKAVKAVVKA